MKYYAHTSEEKQWQTLLEHLHQTAELAGENAAKFNARELGYICGLLHDIGKYSQKFQQKLHGVNFRVDHSTAGAKEVFSLLGERMGKLLAYCISGHHSGLLNHGTIASTEGTLLSRLNNENLEDYSSFRSEIDLNRIKSNKMLPIKLKPQSNDLMGFSLSFFIRMLYSCLVDADFIDTETYMVDIIKPRGGSVSISELERSFSEYLSSFKCASTKINNKRNEILNGCLSWAKKNPGLYSLTVPTGGGKTLSSLAFALNHAKYNNLERIIYVIPYTSIIEQNASIFKSILGIENVLEHHCNYRYEVEDTENIQNKNNKLKLAAENWDIPIVVTTNVQFFESIFSNRSSRCRKLHNISKSVIIFDETQMLPLQYLKPCLMAISELTLNYKSTAVLCTATQPAINQFLSKSVNLIEIMENPTQLYEDFKKVKVTNIGELDDSLLSEKLNENSQVLCIVNTRKHAKEIFGKLDYEDAFHLSTLMCPIHRRETLTKIRERLKNYKKQPCKVISTQLIEAGVDVDFPVVYRASAGIDSIVQSAGRCNREGNLAEGEVFVFKPISEFSKVRGYLERTAKVADMVFRKFEDDPICLEAIQYYFDMLYNLEGEEQLDKKDIVKCFTERGNLLEFDFKTAAEEFRLIDSNNYSVIIPYDDTAISLIEEAKFNPYPRSIARKLQPYTISIYEYEYKALLNNGVLKSVNESFVILDNFEKNYDKKTGLIIPNNDLGEAIFL